MKIFAGVTDSPKSSSPRDECLQIEDVSDLINLHHHYITVLSSGGVLIVAELKPFKTPFIEILFMF